MIIQEYLWRIQLIYDNLGSSDLPNSDTMQRSTIRVGLLSYYEHVAMITASKQPYDLAGITSVLLELSIGNMMLC